MLTDARTQFGLSDATPSQLLHRGKAIDLSIPFRLTGISNNALLELVETATAGAEAQHVRVCVQLLDGRRVHAPFETDSTLAHILTHLKVLPASTTQVLVGSDLALLLAGRVVGVVPELIAVMVTALFAGVPTARHWRSGVFDNDVER